MDLNQLAKDLEEIKGCIEKDHIEKAEDLLVFVIGQVTNAAQQSVQADLLLPCGHNAITSYLYMLGVCSVCNSEANR